MLYSAAVMDGIGTRKRNKRAQLTQLPEGWVADEGMRCGGEQASAVYIRNADGREGVLRELKV